jgi:hypothetical protein
MFRPCAATPLILLLGISVAGAQQNQTVQLPTWNVNSINTTVTVPDGGTGLLGGINYAREGSVSRGVPLLNKIPYLNRLFRNQAIGRDVGASQYTVIPRIIDLEEEEFRQTGVSAETLSYFENRTPVVGGAPGLDPSVARKAQFISDNVARHDMAGQAVEQNDQIDRQAAPALAEVRRQNELARVRRAHEAAELFAEGQRAEREGKANVARIYYQMASRHADGRLQEQIAVRLDALKQAEEIATPLAAEH